ncbi:MAG: 2-phosphosulfolactate phosphatase [Lacisediminihabitans sp.]
MSSPHDQSHYQVRFDWGVAGVRAVAQDADVIVLVDVLKTSPVLELPDVAAAVIEGGFRNRTAVAQWVLAHQAEKGDRSYVAVIAAGDARDDGSVRFAVEDLLAAGAIIDALATAGIDFVSPEGAAACAAFTGLHRAIAHLATASSSGHELTTLGRGDEIAPAIQLDVDTEVLAARRVT